MYPKTIIIATGVGGPETNAHGPNEMINLVYTKKVTCAIAHIIQSCVLLKKWKGKLFKNH